MNFTRVLLIFTAFICLFITDASNAKKKKSKKSKKASSSSVSQGKSKEFKVEWYSPEVTFDEKNKKYKIIKFKGSVSHPATVYIAQPKIPIKAKGRIKYFPTKKAFIKGNRKSNKPFATRTGKDGYFELELKLPSAKLQLPITVKSALTKKKKKMLLPLNLKRMEKFIDKRYLTAKLHRDYSYGIWAGIGGNYLDYTQETSIPSSLKYTSFELVSIFLKAEYAINREWEASIEYKISPGEIPSEASSSTTTVSGSKKYSWNIFDLGGFYTPKSWTNKDLFGDFRADYSLRFGMQHHLMPFLSRTAKNTVVIGDTSMLMLTGGGLVRAYNYTNWVYEVFMRYQIPVSGDLAITPSFSFDGSVGTYYRYDKNLKFGFYWYGQYHNYNFENFQEPTFIDSKSSINGSQVLLYSNIEFRLGYTF